MHTTVSKAIRFGRHLIEVRIKRLGIGHGISFVVSVNVRETELVFHLLIVIVGFLGVGVCHFVI